ncbi:HK97 family phage prohead protease [Pseudarthrobacter sp. H2]|uniref:HK97 family phage prohead protease n=1 Tax=Pseudarthrobacter sp. H2 TaxID=3418415 RepID=UPI003CF36456
MTEIRKINKLFNIDIKSVDEQKRQITFCFSDDQPDRQGEIVDQASWDVKNYMNNPLILWGHDPSENENVLGQGISLDLNNNGKSFITAQFDDAETNPKADIIFRQLVKRTLRCVSAGFINHTWDVQNDVPILKDNELLEVSVVAIPANPRAIALGLKEGSINRKDATWLMDSMRKEADLLETQLKEQITDTGENMDEVKSQLSALTDALGKVTETMTVLGEQNAAMAAKLETITFPVETDEEREAREAKEATDAKATEEAAKVAADEAAAKVETDKKAAEEAQAAADAKAAEEAAKPVEFDENAELTPELQAQIDADLEAAHSNQ